jgi:AcrR family transcriptional regulator
MPAETATMLARALDPGAEAPPDDETSERILDAAVELGAASGIRNLTMDEVARRARVGRMTVYRRFDSKARLIEAVSVRESRRVLAALDAAVRPDAPVEDQIADGFVAGLRIAREHPLLNRLARFEPESVLEVFTANGAAIFAAARDFVAARMRAAQEAGVLGPVAVEESAELLLRLGLSFILIQESVLPLDDDERAREFLREQIAPALVAAATASA